MEKMALFQDFNPIKRFLLRLFEQLSFIGIHVAQLSSLKNLPIFYRDLRKFKEMGGEVDAVGAAVSDFNAAAGIASGHYFHQDLLVARFIYENNPEMHFDFGSRIDGFVSHVAAFRNITLLDIRPVQILGHPQIEFQLCDVMNLSKKDVAESLSCLHTIEHIGLGRYGDAINPIGHILAFRNLLGFLKRGGLFYLSFPISNVSKVMFNKERIFSPTEIFSWSDEKFEIERFDFVDDEGNLHMNHMDLNSLPKLDYGCGIYTLRKN